MVCYCWAQGVYVVDVEWERGERRVKLLFSPYYDHMVSYYPDIVGQPTL